MPSIERQQTVTYGQVEVFTCGRTGHWRHFVVRYLRRSDFAMDL